MNSAQLSSKFKKIKGIAVQKLKVEKALGTVATRVQISSLIDMIDFPFKKFGEPK